MGRLHSELIVVGVAGGSGSGKSTLCEALAAKHPTQIGIIHTDDYMRAAQTLPKRLGRKNFDDPRAVNFARLTHDIDSLRQGIPITRLSKHAADPTGRNPKTLALRTVEPKPLILVEGHFALFDPYVRRRLHIGVFLDAPHAQRMVRRVHHLDEQYERNNVAPGYARFIEPTRKHADLVIPVHDLAPAAVLARFESFLKARGIL